MTCVFCDIINDNSLASMIHSTDDTIAFHPLDPVTPGHMLVVPRDHVADFTEDKDITAAVMYDVARLARMFPDTDFNVITSKGAHATQTVFHFHVHLVPRREGDDLTLPWTKQKKKASVVITELPQIPRPVVVNCRCGGRDAYSY